MRMNAAPTPSNERKVIQILTMVCLSLGFVSVFAVYLPHHLEGTGLSASVERTQAAPPLGHVLPPDVERLPQRAAQAPADRTDGPLFRFVPEPDPMGPLPTAAAPATIATRGDPSTAPDRAPPPTDATLHDAASILEYVEKPRSHRHPLSSLVDGSAHRPSDRGDRWWETPTGLTTAVNFWKDIYATYTSSQVVLHDPQHLAVIYDVVDLRDIDADPNLTEEQRRAKRKDRVRAATATYEAALKQLASQPESALRTKEGRTVTTIFAAVDERDKYRKALARGVRAQTGQRDKFLAGLVISGSWLGEIETIFASYGLPRELTRLVFVESMFQMNARSKAGAAGIWQFMPDTGRRYLRINRFVDERLDPILATHAAAKLLRHNHDALGTWPLAINAYNAGRGRLEQAVARLGTTDITAIINRFDHPAYGFASRNFVPEFLAAREVADNAERYFGPIAYDKPLAYDTIVLPFHISLAEAASLSSITLDELARLNYALDKDVTRGILPVPMGTTLKVPEGHGARFLEMASRGSRTHRGPLEHTVARGETIGQIAALYGVSSQRIEEANRGLKHKPREGQCVYIPFD